MLIGGRVTDYLCAKFGEFSFSRFGFIMRTDRQSHRDAAKRLYRATVVGVSNYIIYNIIFILK